MPNMIGMQHLPDLLGAWMMEIEAEMKSHSLAGRRRSAWMPKLPTNAPHECAPRQGSKAAEEAQGRMRMGQKHRIMIPML